MDENSLDSIEESWCKLESAVEELGKILKQTQSTAVKALTSARDGSAPKLRKSLDALANELGEVPEALISARSLLASLEDVLLSADTLASEINVMVRDAFPGHRVVKHGDEVAMLPVLVKVESNKVRVDKENLPTQRPSVITAAVDRVLKASDGVEAFLRALRGAFKLVSGDQLVGRVTLEKIYQLLSTGPPGIGIYSRHDFRIDLQRLLLSGPQIIDGVRVELRTAAAGPYAIPLYALGGDLLNIGYVEFVEAGASDE